MRKVLRKKYETNSKFHEIWIYYFLLISFKLFKRYKSINKEIVNAIDTFENKKLSKKEYKSLYRKFIIFRYIYSLRASEYYLFNIKNKNYEEIDTFMPRRFTKKYYAVINSERFRKIFDKKNLLYEKFKKYYKREVICIKNTDDFENFRKFIRNKKAFILKPLSGHSGKGIEIIHKKDFKNINEMFLYTLKSKPYVGEELIKQSNEIGKFHPNSVNTIRVVSFQYNECVSILWAFIRMGQGNSTVDNMGSDGLGALIDFRTGIIISDAIDWKGENVSYHPDSKIKFKGFQVPHWNELIGMVTELASEIPEMHCIGWDLALTDEGWVLVEGNARPQCVTIQTITKKGYKSYYDKMCILIRKQKQIEKEIYEGKIEV